MAQRVLSIACPDAKGLVARITGTLFEYGCNVTENGEFVDSAQGRFFMRTAYAGDIADARVLETLRGRLPAEAEVRISDVAPKRILIMATKEPHCLGDLLIRATFQDLNAAVVAVVANHDVLRKLTESFDVPFHHVPHAARSREAHEASVLEHVAACRPDYVVLAKYMRVLSPAFIARLPNRIINIHHSFLPAFIGANPYRQAYERGVKIIGATAHFASADLDEGPIIAQDTVSVNHSHGPTEMARSGRDVEKRVLARALRYVLEERVFVHGNRTVIFE
jgi:formyltetrahydrofolate deformylase